jgi:hypothetical protein
MNEPRQKLMEILGADGCYILCIVHLGEQQTRERVDAIPVFLDALEKVHVMRNCLVLEAAAILSDIPGVKWSKRTEGADYEVKPDELAIDRWERTTGSGTVVHFVVSDGKGGVAYDPYGDSRTVREGTLVSKRIFSRA